VRNDCAILNDPRVLFSLGPNPPRTPIQGPSATAGVNAVEDHRLVTFSKVRPRPAPESAIGIRSALVLASDGGHFCGDAGTARPLPCLRNLLAENGEQRAEAAAIIFNP
jgi:hypothetical protein